MKHLLSVAALGFLTAMPAQASSLLCRPQLAAILPFELRLNADGSSITGTLSLGDQTRNLTLTESVANPITRYLADGYSIGFSRTNFVPARNPFPADAGRAISALAETITLPDGTKLENIALACVAVKPASAPVPAPAENPPMPSATYGEMIQLMGHEESAPDESYLAAPGTIADAIQSL